MRLIVAGAGGATRHLLRALGDAWEVAVVDHDAAALERLEKVRDVEPVHGDSSDAGVLGAAGLAGAQAFLAAAGDDDVNLAACELARRADVPAITALAADPERLADYRERNIAAFSAHRMAARRIEIALEPRRVSSAAFAGGAAEALEFRIAADSPILGRSLAEMHSESWLVVAVLRKGELLIPHGGTRLEAGDLVTVVGSADDYSAIVRTFTRGEPRFPLDYGAVLAVAAPSAADLPRLLSEARYLAEVSLAPEMLIVHPDPVGLPPQEARELAAALDEAEAADLRVRSRVAADPVAETFEMGRDEGVGVVIAPPPGRGRLANWFATAGLLQRARRSGIPLLVARGSHPYTAMVVSVYDRPAQWAATGAAIDLAARSRTRLLAAAVRPPAFVTVAERRPDEQRFAARLREEAAVRGVAVRSVEREGNPVRALVEVVGRDSLLVSGMPDRDPSWWRLGTVGHLVRGAEASVLLVPPLARPSGGGE